MRKILEIGCGYGRITKRLAEAFPEAHITAVDLSPDQLSNARTYCADYLDRIDFLEYDIYSPKPLPGTAYDTAIAVEVLLHHPYPVVIQLLEAVSHVADNLVNYDWSEEHTGPLAPHVWVHDYAELYRNLGLACEVFVEPRKFNGQQQKLFIASNRSSVGSQEVARRGLEVSGDESVAQEAGTAVKVAGSSESPEVYADGQTPVHTNSTLPRLRSSVAISSTMTEVESRVESETTSPATGRRAIVCYVEDKPHLVQQLLALYLSWLETNSPDTDLVVMGPEAVLDQLPEEVIKIVQQPAADDPVWGGYRYINPIAGLNGAGAEQLDAYSHLLRTDADTFITPAWNAFYPATFTFGTSTYANADVPQRIQALAAEYGLTHRGMTNIHTTWYGSTAVVRRAAAFTELLTKHLLTHEFAQDAGQWPGWYRGVAVRYAGEIAVNHCAPEAQRSELLDAPSTSPASIERYPHIHCWHTDQLFSKHTFMRGDYSRQDIDDRDVSIIHNYCLALSLLSREELAPVG